jgi:muramoyltetrapeptide carboxypeptidase
MIPQAIKPGDIIGVVAPSEIIKNNEIEEIESSKTFFEKLGYKIKFGKYVKTNTTGYGATGRQKAEDINNMFKDNEIKAIICAEGGYDCNSTFDYLDYELIKKNPKIICGYSDITALCNAIYSKTGLVTFNGPNFKSISDWNGIDKYSSNELIKRFQDKSLELGTNDDKYDTIKPGQAKGILIGGNLSLITRLVCGKYKVDFSDKILFIEELAYESNPNFVNHYLYYLKQNGVFDKIKGIWVGNYEHESQIVLEKILLDVLDGDYDFPIIKSNNFGHCERKTVIPIGTMAEINTKKDVKIKLLEDCVR